MSNGKCLLLLDGLDEVSQSNLDRVIGKINDVSKKYSGNQFVISCRVAAYNHFFPKFTDVEIADFDDTQIERFINRWFEADKETGAECWKQIKDSSPLKEMAKLPILLTLLCIEFDEDYGFPTSRSELYESAINILLRKWDSSRRIKRDSIYKELSAKKKASMLSEIAYQNFIEGKYFFKEKDISSQLENYLENLNFIENEVDGNVVLKEIAAQHGILVPRAKRVYSFIHLSFQEFFTASYIANRNNELIDKMVDEYATVGNWRQIFLLTSEMLPSADYLMDSLNRKILSIIDSDPQFKNILKEINFLLSDTNSNYSISIRRIFTFYLFVDLTMFYGIGLDIGSDRIRARTLVNARNLAQMLVPKSINDLELHYNLDSGFIFARNLGFEFNEYLALFVVKALDFDKILLLGDILPMYQLMVECMNTNCTLSSSKRKELLDGILLVEH